MTIDFTQLFKELFDTLYMSFTSLLIAVVFGLFIGIILYCTQSGGLYENRYINKLIDFVVNVLRAVPFIILMILVVPFTTFLVGTMLGAKAAIPSLSLASAPFFARMCVIAFNEVDKGTIEACKSMGATKLEIIFKVLLPESLPALISGICVTGISLIGYTAMAGAIGAGGLGNLAYMYGWIRRDPSVLYISTILIIVIVFAIQGFGDYLVKKIDKR